MSLRAPTMQVRNASRVASGSFSQGLLSLARNDFARSCTLFVTRLDADPGPSALLTRAIRTVEGKRARLEFRHAGAALRACELLRIKPFFAINNRNQYQT